MEVELGEFRKHVVEKHIQNCLCVQERSACVWSFSKTFFRVHLVSYAIFVCFKKHTDQYNMCGELMRVCLFKSHQLPVLCFSRPLSLRQTFAKHMSSSRFLKHMMPLWCLRLPFRSRNVSHFLCVQTWFLVILCRVFARRKTLDISQLCVRVRRLDIVYALLLFCSALIYTLR
jgi:hypothetical protein